MASKKLKKAFKDYNKKYPDNGLLAQIRNNSAIKNDTGKPMLSLNPREGLELQAKALEYGMKKYNRNNFKKGMAWSRLIDATLRHVTAFAHGEDNDPESGINHIGHALASLAMLSYNIKNHKHNDDR